VAEIPVQLHEAMSQLCDDSSNYVDPTFTLLSLQLLNEVSIVLPRQLSHPPAVALGDLQLLLNFDFLGFSRPGRLSFYFHGLLDLTGNPLARPRTLRLLLDNHRCPILCMAVLLVFRGLLDDGRLLEWLQLAMRLDGGFHGITRLWFIYYAEFL